MLGVEELVEFVGPESPSIPFPPPGETIGWLPRPADSPRFFPLAGLSIFPFFFHLSLTIAMPEQRQRRDEPEQSVRMALLTSC